MLAGFPAPLFERAREHGASLSEVVLGTVPFGLRRFAIFFLQSYVERRLIERGRRKELLRGELLVARQIEL